MEDEKPLVSIIIPSFNSALYIEEAILSAINQTYSNKEIIVIDDGSTDDTIELLKKYNNQITIISQENKGVAKARNTGIEHSKGVYIANLDADDKWYLDRLDKMIPFMRDNNFSLVTSNFVYVDEFRKRISNHASFSGNYKAPIPAKQYDHLLKEATAFTFFIASKELIDEVGGYDEMLGGEAEDYDLWLRLLKTGAVWGYYEEPLAEYMLRRGALSKKYSKKRKAALKYIFMKHVDKIGRLRGFKLYRYHLGGYRLDMALLAIKSQNFRLLLVSLLRLMKSPLFTLNLSTLITRKIFTKFK